MKNSAPPPVDWDDLGRSLATPSAASVARMRAMRNEGGTVGIDDLGRLVRLLPGGATELIDDDTGQKRCGE